MSDWADELANEIADQTYVGSDGRTDAERVADALRTVQRETAEECCKLVCHSCRKGMPLFYATDARWSHYNPPGVPYGPCDASVIRARFKLEAK